MSLSSNKAFTLVELAIVITIIGLLIGGVLKGQELLQNARMTSAGAQLKAASGAALTFKDIYKAYPGDITTPANFIQNCTTSPCNISGNADGAVGPIYSGGSWYNDENNNFWLHLAKAGMISGVDPNATWTSGTLWAGSYPAFPIGGRTMIVSYNVADRKGHWWWIAQPNAAGTSGDTVIPLNLFAKFDLKFDDGKPWSGTHMAHVSGCTGLASNATVYDPNISTGCIFNVQTEF